LNTKRVWPSALSPTYKKFKSKKAIPKSWSEGHFSLTRPWAAVCRTMSQTKTHKHVCVCHVAALVIHGTIRGLSLHEML